MISDDISSGGSIWKYFGAMSPPPPKSRRQMRRMASAEDARIEAQIASSEVSYEEVYPPSDSE